MTRPTDEWPLQMLIDAAVRAPSSHNTQPWLFRVGDAAIDLVADRTRALPANDPHDRELTISCGAALFNVRVAAAQMGFGCDAALLPDADEPDLLARVLLVPASEPQPPCALYGAIARRRTVRERFADEPVAGVAVEALAQAVEDEGARLHVLRSATLRHRAAALVAEGDAVQWGDARWRRELASWMHPRRSGDGLSLPTLAVPVAQAVVRTFDFGGGIAAKDRELADGSPLLAVLATAGDTPRDWLLAGQALQHLLLTAVVYGLQASYLNQPVQVPALRSRLAELIGGAWPQLLLRVGVPRRDVPPAPRRSLEEVVLAG